MEATAGEIAKYYLVVHCAPVLFTNLGSCLLPTKLISSFLMVAARKKQERWSSRSFDHEHVMIVGSSAGQELQP
eukprot:1153035-Pelagomonas_calceolata.AAC.8